MTAAPRDRPVTRTDVAKHAGVSSAVVSYVVNSGPKNVAPETRERVLKAIEELGYRPNAKPGSAARWPERFTEWLADSGLLTEPETKQP